MKPAVNKKSGYEVLVQGNQITFATKLLIEEFKIPRKIDLKFILKIDIVLWAPYSFLIDRGYN